MASTRYAQQPLQIYQDPVTPFDHAPMPSMQNPSNPKKLSPLRPIKNAAARSNILFNSPRAGRDNQSPSKSDRPTSSSPLRVPFGTKLNMITMPPPGAPVYNTDSMEKKQPLTSKFKTGPQKALFTTFSSAKGAEKENYPQSIYPSQPVPYNDGFGQGNFSLEGLYGQKAPQKRTLMEAAPIHEPRPFKKPKMEEGHQVEEVNELPEPDSFPPLHDDGTKPAHSYAQLIGMSILRAPNRRLTLAQIYKWISDTYSFYNAAEAGWQNSIRHNLSLNKAFIKQERPKDDPGKGNYWAIEGGMEHQFIKDKSSRKAAGPNENVPVLSTTLAPANRSDREKPESLMSNYKPLTLAPQELPPQPTCILSEPQLPPNPELSSDATIPASDTFVAEVDQEEAAEEGLPSSPLIQSSPPTAMMHSSPPVARHIPRRHDTPPPVPLFPSSSRTRSHKRKFASMDDSGYFSSLDSSAMRPHQVGRLLTSEIDRPRIKRGRAEEEIARLRGSSYDSPTKGRTLSGFAPPSSSPLRRGMTYDSSQMLPPLTPAVKLRAPVKPPPSVSPNTNLRIHRDKVRELVGSPLRDLTCLDENQPWSPAFHLDESTSMFHDFSTDFDIFADTNAELLSLPGTGSPEKRSIKRPRLDRCRSANKLADLSSNTFNKNISTPLLKLTPSVATSAYSSPTHGLGVIEASSKMLSFESPSKLQSPAFSMGTFDLPQEDFYGAEFLSEEMMDFGGMDIMQGFQRIGSGGQSSRSTPKTNSRRPAVDRSFSSLF